MLQTISIVGNKGIGYGMVGASYIPGTIGKGLVMAGSALCGVSAWLSNAGKERLLFAEGLSKIKEDPELITVVNAAVKDKGIELRAAVIALALGELTKETAATATATATADSPDTAAKTTTSDTVTTLDITTTSDIVEPDIVVEPDIGNGSGVNKKTSDTVATATVAAAGSLKPDLSFLGKAEEIRGVVVNSDDVAAAAVG